jgi:hypothetical protein
MLLLSECAVVALKLWQARPAAMFAKSVIFRAPDRRSRRAGSNSDEGETMHKLDMYLVAMAASFGVIMLASEAMAQTRTSQESAARDAAIHKCVLQAVAEYPRGPDSNDSARTALYKACMTAAGFAP